MKLTKKQRSRVQLLSKIIKTEWKKTVDSLIQIGGCFHELRLLHSRKSFVSYIKKEFFISEVHAHRLESLYLVFGNKKTQFVLSSKPSVLYLLANTVEVEKIENLANGKKIKIRGKYKLLSELTFADTQFLTKKIKKNKNENESIYDLKKYKNIERDFASSLERIGDLSLNIERFLSDGRKIKDQDLVLNYIDETIHCLQSLKRKME